MEVIQNAFQDFWGRLENLFGEIRISDVFDVLIVAFLVYELIILVRHTRAAQLAKGILILLLSFAIATIAQMRTLSYVLQGVMNFGIVVLAVVFQPELRRAIEQVGGANAAFSKLFRVRPMEDALRSDWQKTIVAVCDAAERMAEEHIGALIVMERNTNMGEILRTGTPLHSEVNVEVLCTIFYEGTPLHDGAVVIRDAKIEAAGCFLPLSNNLEISKDMGTRHRAALGLSENSDAIIVVVSEENSVISVAKNGVLIRRLERQTLFNLLVSEIVPPKPTAEKKYFFQKWRQRPRKEEAGQNETKE